MCWTDSKLSAIAGILIERDPNTRLHKYKVYFLDVICTIPTQPKKPLAADINVVARWGLSTPALEVVDAIAKVCCTLLGESAIAIPPRFLEELEKMIRILMIEDIVTRVAEYFNYYKYFELKKGPKRPSKQKDIAGAMKKINKATDESNLFKAMEEASSKLLDYFFDKCAEKNKGIVHN